MYAIRECPKCKSNSYTNKSLVMMINECGHPLCKHCVENLFHRNAAPCEICGKMLKKNNFWEQIFDDPRIEKENYIRKRLRKIYNMHESDFPSLREYNDYLEHIEELVINLLEGINVEETEAEIREYQEAHSAEIERNRKRLNADEEWVLVQITEENAMKARLHAVKPEPVEIAPINEASDKTKEIMKELRESALPAEAILDRERKKRIELGLEEKAEAERRKQLKKARKPQEGITFSVHRIAGNPYYHRLLVFDTNGPPMPTVQEMEDAGYLRFIRKASDPSRAGGYTSSLACYRAILEVRLDLFTVKQKSIFTPSEEPEKMEVN